MEYGTKVNGRLEPIYGTLGLSQAGQTYEARIDTQGIPDENMAITDILQLENEIPDLRVTYVETTPGGSIIVQFKDMGPGQFGFETLLAFLPQVLFLGGIIALGITLFWVVPALQGVPNYVWYIAAAGGVMLAGAVLLGLVKLPSLPAAIIVQEREKLALAAKTAGIEAEKAEAQEEKTQRDLKRQEDKVVQKRAEAFSLIEKHEHAVRVYKDCDDKTDRLAPPELDRQIVKCHKLAENALVLQQKMSIAVEEFNAELGAVGKTDKTKAEQLKMAKDLVSYRKGVEFLKRHGESTAGIPVVTLAE